MITKKHFEAIADIIRVNTHTAQRPEMQTYISTWAVEELIAYFSKINPSFNDEKFRYVARFNVPKNKEVA
jgi:methionine synthase I (cobalamin-dependent)